MTALPGGLLTKVGKMRAAFGKVNTLHNHVLPWTDRPLVTQNLVGGEDGIDDAGISVARLIPNRTAVPRSDRAGVPRRLRRDALQVEQARRPELRRPPARVSRHLRNRPTSISAGRMRTATIPQASSDGVDLGRFTTKLFGVDATLRWRPLTRAIYHQFVGRSEVIWSHRRTGRRPAASMGYYVSGDYQFARRWFVGGALRPLGSRRRFSARSITAARPC